MNGLAIKNSVYEECTEGKKIIICLSKVVFSTQDTLTAMSDFAYPKLDEMAEKVTAKLSLTEEQRFACLLIIIVIIPVVYS